MAKNSKVLRIPTPTIKIFIEAWLKLLKPYHNLRNRDMDVLASFMYRRYILSLSISDSNLLDEVTMSELSKKIVMEDSGVSKSYFNSALTRLRKSGIIREKRIDPMYIPLIDPNTKDYTLTFHFILENDTKESDN